MAITRFNAKNGLSVGTGSINVIDNEGNATFASSILVGVASSTDKLAVLGTTSLTGSVLPGSTTTYDLGSSSKFWSTLFAANLSGSLTRLSDGSSYLIAGTDIGISTGSNGSVTISNTAQRFYQWNELSPSPALNTTASISIAGGLGSAYDVLSVGSDVYFFVSGSSSSTYGASVFGGDLLVSGTLETHTITNFSTNDTTSPLTVNGSSRGTNNSGRGVSVLGATGGGGVGGGNIVIDAGDGTGSSSSGGSVTIDAGNSTTVSSAGSVTIAGGTTTSTGGTAQAGSVTITGGNLPSGGPGTAGSISLTTGNAANAGATPGNVTLTAQRGKVILKQSTAAVAVGTDTFLYVSGTISDSDKSVFAGDVVVSGSLSVFSGVSGSLTNLTDGTSYLVAGANVTIVTGSNGSITISSTATGGGGGGDPDAQYLVLATTASLSAERSFVPSTGLTAVDGGANSNYTLSINDSIVATVSGTTFTGVTKHNVGLSGSLTQLTDGTSYLIAGSNVTIVTGSSGNVTVSTTGLAPNSSQFLTLALDGNLSGERVFTPGTGLLGTDAGANGNYTLSINDSVVATVSGATFTGPVKLNAGISGSLTSSNVSEGQVVVAGTGGVLSGSNNFWWSNSTGRVGIGTTTTTYKLTVREDVAGALSIGVANPSLDSAASSRLVLDAQGGTWNIENLRTGGALTFKFNTSEALRINNANNVGIGGTNPTSRLEVTGSTGDSSASALHILNSSNTSMLLVRNDGNVGIGTATPAKKLHIVNNQPLRMGLAAEYWDFLQNNTNQWAFLSNASVYSIFMDNATGNVGIGTNTTSDKLSVNGSLSVTGSALPGSDNTYSLGSTSKRWNNVYASNISGSITSSNVSAGQVVVAGTGGVLSGSNNFFWDNSTGNIGIGTSSFTARLFVSGASTASTSTVVVREGVSSPTAGAMTLDVQNSAGTSLMVVSGSGFVGIGTTTTITSNKVSIFGATAPDTFAGHILLSSNTASSAANNGGQLNFQMYDGSSLRGSAFIKGAKENSTASNYSTYLSFGTRNNGDAAITERMRIDSGGSVQIGLVAETYANIARVFISGSSNTAASALVVREGALSALAGATVMSIYNREGSQIFYVTGSGNVGIDNGNLIIGTAGKGIDFSITTNSSGSVDSELLDDYERGTWTPTISTTGGSITLNATQTKGVYVKIGRMVWIGGHVRSSSVSSPTGDTVISGLPFTIDNWNAGQPAYMSFFGEWFSATGLGTTFGHAGGSLFQGLNSIEMFRYTTAGAFSSATAGNWDGSCEFSFTFCYNANV